MKPSSREAPNELKRRVVLTWLFMTLLAVIALIGTPALFDRFLEEGGRERQRDEVAGPPTPEEIERLRQASPRFGITLLPDWPPK